MRAWVILSSIVAVCILGASGCSKSPTTAPKTVTPPEIVATDYQYDIRLFADSGYVVKRMEYADVDGTVRKITFTSPVWQQTLKLKPGDHMYIHAVVDFPSCLDGGIQITGPATFYRRAWVERCDGPGTADLVIDELVK